MEIAQGVDAHGAAAEEAWQGAGVLKIAIKPAAEHAGDDRVFRVDLGHCHGVAAVGEGPGQQDTDIAPVAGRETAAAFAPVFAAGRRQFLAYAVDSGGIAVLFDGGASLAM